MLFVALKGGQKNKKKRTKQFFTHLKIFYGGLSKQQFVKIFKEYEWKSFSN